MDEAVADEFTGPGDVVDQLMYGFSKVSVLPIEDFSFFRFYRLHA